LASRSDTGKDGIQQLCSQQIPAIYENPSSILSSKKVVYASEYQVLQVFPNLLVLTENWIESQTSEYTTQKKFNLPVQISSFPQMRSCQESSWFRKRGACPWKSC